MRITILYSTQMGTTQMIANLITEKLGAEHEVTEVMAFDASLDAIKGAQAVIFAIPTYDEGNVEGMARPLVEALAHQTGLTQLFAVVSPGDSSYEHFCGAAEIIEQAATKAGMKRVHETLKIDNYMMNMSAANEAIVSWVETLKPLLA